MKRQSCNRSRLSPAERLALHTVAAKLLAAAKTGDPAHLSTQGRGILASFRGWLSRNQADARALARLRESDLDFLPRRRRDGDSDLVETLH